MISLGFDTSPENRVGQEGAFRNHGEGPSGAVASDYTAILSGHSMSNGQTGRPAFFTYSFVSPPSYLSHPYYAGIFSPSDLATARVFTEAEKQTIRAAIKIWTDACGLTAFEVTQTTGDMNFTCYDLAGAFAGAASSPQRLNSGPDGSDVFLDVNFTASSLYIVLHEIGHAIGLKHPHDGATTLAPEFDNANFTVMSYIGTSATLGSLDVAAARYLYGNPDQDGSQVSAWSWNATTETMTQTGTAANETIIGMAARDMIRAGAGNDTIDGKDGDDQLWGEAGQDMIYGGWGADRLDGGDGDDRLYGSYGNDILTGGAGSDYLEGGADTDTAVYAGLFLGYSSVSATRVAGGREGGADILNGVERVRFLDGMLSFETGQAVWTNDEATMAVARLYQAVLGRTPDVGGLEHYRTAVDQGYDLMHFTRVMIDSPEFIARFGALSNQQFIEQIYRFVLGRDGDAGGVATYVAALSQGYSRADVVLVFSESPENKVRYLPTWEGQVRKLETGRYSAEAEDQTLLSATAGFDDPAGGDDDGWMDVGPALVAAPTVLANDAHDWFVN